MFSEIKMKNRILENFLSFDITKLEEAEKGIKRRHASADGLDSGQVIKIGKNGRYVIYLAYKPFKNQLQVIVNFFDRINRELKDKYLKSGAETEMQNFFSGKDFKVFNYIKSVLEKRGFKKKFPQPTKSGKVNINSVKNYIAAMEREIKYNLFSDRTEILDKGDERVLVSDYTLDKDEKTAIDLTNQASRFFDSLGARVGKRIPVVFDSDLFKGGGGLATRGNHFIKSGMNLKTLIHETAHYMWFFSMDKEQRSIVALYYLLKISPDVRGSSGGDEFGAKRVSTSTDFEKERSKFGDKSVLPSGYSTYNPSELWAEIVAHLFENKGSKEMSQLFNIAINGTVDDLIKTFDLDEAEVESYLSGENRNVLDAAISLGKKPEESENV